jgi:hypothetical protein|tara:strand:+ start:278 stop:901 length:624 start_codon:yes stop_codon:yes gene_type:complete
MADQADTIIVKANILSIGETVQVTPKYSKFTFEYTVQGNDEEVIEAESPAWNKGKLEVGKTYELALRARENPTGGYYTPSVEKLTPVAGGGVQRAQSKPKPPTAVSPAEYYKDKPIDKPVVRKPELNSRWREFSTHSRTAQMQATERVGHRIELLLKDRLVTEDDKPISKIKESTLATWYIEEYDRYWIEIGQREPVDSFGNIRDQS